MICRGNWKIINTYLKYRLEVDQVSEVTVNLELTWLRHLLEWADEVPFEHIPQKRPTLPEYLKKARLDGKQKSLSIAYTKKVLSASKRFFIWLIANKKGYKHVFSYAWLNSLKYARFIDNDTEHEAVTLEEILAIANAPTRNMRDKRIQAAAVFWFLSGIRIGAFVTLPISAIDLNELSIKQWPSLGVKTKFHKRDTTYFLNIPELINTIKEWDCLVRKELPGNAYWFAPLSPETCWFDPRVREAGKHRSNRASKDLKEFLISAGLKYHSPHKFRHGNAVESIKRCKTVTDLKAVSQNLMHSNLSITDGIYGILSREDRQNVITKLGVD
jgi:site-specific recombinase XerC